MEANARLITRSYPGEERASATLATEETSGKEDAAARQPGRPSIPPGAYDESNNGDPENHQNGMTLFSAVLAPNTFNITVEDTDHTRALRHIVVVLTLTSHATTLFRSCLTQIQDRHVMRGEKKGSWGQMQD